MLWPPPRTESARPCSRAKLDRARRRRPCRWAGRRAPASCRSCRSRARVASSKPASPGREQRTAQALGQRVGRLFDGEGGHGVCLGRGVQRVQERLGLLDAAGRRRSPRSRAAASRSGRSPPRRPRSRVARSWRPQISVVGTAIRARSAGGIARQPELAHQRAERPCAPGVAGAVEVVGGERLPALAHPLAQAVEVERALAPQAVVRAPRSVARGSASSASAEPRRGLERGQAERVHEHEPAEPVAVVGGEAGRDRAAERVARPAPAATGRCARSARRARRPSDRRRAWPPSTPRRRGRAGRGRPRGGSSRAPGSPASSGPRTPRARAGAPAAGRRRPRARRSRRRPASAAARVTGDPGQQLLARAVVAMCVDHLASPADAAAAHRAESPNFAPARRRG